MLKYITEPHLTDKWLNAGWPAVPLGLSALYLLLIYLLKQWIETRDSIKSKPLIILWNTFLAVFSIAGFVRFAPSALLQEVAEGGFIHSVCLVNPFSTQTLNFWMSLFVISKFVEFGDTIFLILRKAPLTFLHVYHHVTVAFYSWYGATSRSSVGHWFVSMNYFVHSFMYTYFMLKGFGVYVPSVVAKAITCLQLVQFLNGLICVLVAAARLWNGEVCNSALDFTLFGLVIYGSYFILFINFFYHRYISPKQQKRE